MGHFVEGADRSQLMLLPECLDDRVSQIEQDRNRRRPTAAGDTKIRAGIAAALDGNNEASRETIKEAGSRDRPRRFVSFAKSRGTLLTTCPVSALG